MPLANSVPVSVSVAFTAACAVDVAMSDGVAEEAKEKEHGVSEPEVESATGSMYMLAIEYGGGLPHSWLPCAASSEEHVALQLDVGAGWL